MRVTPSHTGFGAGTVFTKTGFERWRSTVAGAGGEDLAAALDDLATSRQ